MTPDQIIGLAILAFSSGYFIGQITQLSEGRSSSNRRRETRRGLTTSPQERSAESPPLAELRSGAAVGGVSSPPFAPHAVTDSEGVGPSEGESVRSRPKSLERWSVRL